jgi:hypothetical protein
MAAPENNGYEERASVTRNNNMELVEKLKGVASY